VVINCSQPNNCNFILATSARCGVLNLLDAQKVRRNKRAGAALRMQLYKSMIAQGKMDRIAPRGKGAAVTGIRHI